MAICRRRIRDLAAAVGKPQATSGWYYLPFGLYDAKTIVSFCRRIRDSAMGVAYHGLTPMAICRRRIRDFKIAVLNKNFYFKTAFLRIGNSTHFSVLLCTIAKISQIFFSLFDYLFLGFSVN
jgi:hypothetical protein